MPAPVIAKRRATAQSDGGYGPEDGIEAGGGTLNLMGSRGTHRLAIACNRRSARCARQEQF